MTTSNKIARKGLLLFLTLSLLLVSACSREPTGTTTGTVQTTGTTTQAEPTETIRPQPRDVPLVIGYLPFTANFNPFFAQTGPDRDVVMLTSLSLLTTDRGGAVIQQAIEGERRPYNGSSYFYQGIADVATHYDADADTTTVTWTLRGDLLFSDGVPVTADDVIFTYYVLLDPACPLQTDLHDLPILGVTDYQRQIRQEVYERYETMSMDIYVAGADHSWAEEDSWNEDMQKSFWQHVKSAWILEIQAIIDHVYTRYRGHAEQYTGYLPAEIDRDERKVVLAMTIWDFAHVAEDGYLVGAYSENAWNLPDEVYPDAEDFYHETWLAYTGNPEAFWGIEGVQLTSVLEAAQQAFIETWAPEDEAMKGQGVPDISGISKIDEQTVSVTIAGNDPAAVHKLNIPVAPLHYYGDLALYDYAAGLFGFPFADLSSVESRTAEPMGGGPYRFERYQDKTVYLTANELYYKGQPAIAKLQLKETAAADLIAAVGSGIADMTVADCSQATVAEILRYNQNDKLDGNRIATYLQTEQAYAYIGLNAATVNVAGDPAAEASRQLRRGLAIMLAASRASNDVSAVRPAWLGCPLSGLNWAAEADACDAFSSGIDGGRLYDLQMTADQKIAAASTAAVSFFEAAGYSPDATGARLAEAPEGAALSYSLMVMDDMLTHPVAGAYLETAISALKSIGISLDFDVMDDPELFVARLESGEVDLWYGVRQMAAEPDFFSAYHSDSINSREADRQGNYFNLADADLDILIEEAALTADLSEREQRYQACLAVVLDWAVEVPLHLQQSLAVISPQRVDLDAVVLDMTVFWNWRHEIEKLQLPFP